MKEFGQLLTLLHSETPKLYTIVTFLNAIGLIEISSLLEKVSIGLYMYYESICTAE